MYVYLQAYEPNATVMQPLVAFVTFYRGDRLTLILPEVFRAMLGAAGSPHPLPE